VQGNDLDDAAKKLLRDAVVGKGVELHL